jgi:hypothetical protein
VKRLVIIVTLVILLVGIASIGLGDMHVSVADTSIPDNKVISSVRTTINYSASGVIMIAWTTASGEGGSNG